MRAAGLVCIACVAALAQAGSGGPRIEYSKFFKGSVPEYVAITIEKPGQVTYQEAKDDERPIRFQIPADQVNEVFGLAAKLDHFTRPLESGLKVAQMGVKSFRFADGGTTGEVKFNYSEDPDARQLADWFERITETEQDFIGLERAVKFDKLGVNQALLLLQITYDKKRLMAPEQFLPLLDRIAKNESFMHMSRERAATIAGLFRNQTVANTEGRKTEK
ncbi:MAG: hypothetical protein ACR2NN_15635 [Bryobacteraceae bacterium]